MLSRSLAILLAIVGLYVSAVEAAAQPRGWGGGRGWGRPGGFAGAPRFGGPGGPRGGFPGDPPAFGRPGGRFGGYPGGFAPPPPGFGGAAPRVFGGGPRPGAFGYGRGEQEEARRAVREGRQVPLGQAIEAVRRRAPGRELDAGLEPGPNGRPVYRLRWAGQDGRRQDYMVDAGTGQVLGVVGGP